MPGGRHFKFKAPFAVCLAFSLFSGSLQAGILFTNIFSFDGTNGGSPATLVRAGNNRFYGITEYGGPNYVSLSSPDYGGIFSITADGAFSNLCFFESTNGRAGAYLTPGVDGNFYGTTLDSVFKLNPDGTMANPNLAPAFNGMFPMAALGILQDHDGTLYGTTENGGPSNYGTVYKIDTNGVFSTFVTFNGTNGAIPKTLLLAADNSFYGLTQGGGNGFNGTTSNGNGVIFRLDRSGNLTNVFNFSNPNEEPNWMVQGSDGDLYGVTYGVPGIIDAGSVFRITTNGVLVWSFSFNGTNGYGGWWITAGNDGNFYGLTGYGGSNYDGTENSGFGTIFRITPNGSFTSLAQFDGTNDSVPGTIIQGTDGDLYGTSMNGGAFGNGAIFKLTLPACPTNRLMLTTAVDINSPYEGGASQLVQESDGALYGGLGWAGTGSYGAIFKLTLSGSLTILASFNGTNGLSPGMPILAPDGYFYGTTYGGGTNFSTTNLGYGTIYQMDSNGVVTSLFSFSHTNGMDPTGLVLGSDGSFYGTTQAGGLDATNGYNGDGTIFKMTTNRDFTLLASFGGTNGSGPTSFIQASDGNFYGTTSGGGTTGLGTVFRMTPDGQLTNLAVFNGTNGWLPNYIMQASDGCLYGFTFQGGISNVYAAANGAGVVFKATTNGDLSALVMFNVTNGAVPTALAEARNGVFYCVTERAYARGGGELFQVTTNGDLTHLLSFGTSPAMPGNPAGPMTKASDGNFYGYAQQPYPGAIYSIRPVQAPVIQPSSQSNQVNLNWNAWAGYSYQVLYETNLVGSNWNLLSTVTPQTNGITSYSDPIGPDSQRFYQVVLQLP